MLGHCASGKRRDGRVTSFELQELAAADSPQARISTVFERRCQLGLNTRKLEVDRTDIEEVVVHVAATPAAA